MAGMVPVVGVRMPEGRCGTTLLMQLLGTAPEIEFDRRYPSEYRWLSYFAHMAAQMTEPFDPDRHVGLTPFFFGAQPAWGPVPFESDVVDVTGLTAPLLRGMWTTFSDAVRVRHPAVRWYAEKLALPVEPFLEAGIELRIVDLLRDPRDMLASILAFTATGIDGFDDPHAGTVDEYVDRFVATLHEGLDRMDATPPDVDRVVVTYEDLATDLAGVAARLGRWLGVELDAGAVLGQRPAYAHHMTTDSVDASIGRWRTDLDGATAARVAAALGPRLVAHGYQL
jgi:hypothetical protein